MSADAPPVAPPPFETPDGISPDAYPAFKQMLRACGKTAFRMPSSCELFLRQYLSHHPTELGLLTAALRRGVPEKIAAHNGRDGYDELLDAATALLAQEAGVGRPLATWAVEAWATGLGRPPGYAAPPVTPGVVEPPPGFDKPQVSDRSVRRVMAGVAAAGGAFGGLLGNGSGMLVLLFTDRRLGTQYSSETEEVVLYVVAAVLALVGGVCGGVGAFAGWMFGRGDEWPWGGFVAACGAAFGTGCLLFFCAGPGLITAVAMGFSAFGAAFTTASRGARRI
ncbi:MAG TPA: hypothetical protein VFG68_02110 [Fimbriiglobus sp.]|nr:hypothetical protein [Fimbriiglobus sp.]